MNEGDRLSKYEIGRALGRGAAGIVLEGWDSVIQRRVAIKTVRMDDMVEGEAAEQIDRFRREARAAGQLVHPNIVTVHDYGEAEGVAYIVMEFVEGPSLKAVLEAGFALSRGDVVRIMEDVLAGLAFSHQHGVIHRDIKPANVMLTGRDISTARAKIADFGIARVESSTLTQAGTMMGTPAYMAPEQFLGEPIDARSDIYAAGVLLYQLLTGQRPFEGSISSIMHQVLTIEARPPSMLVMTVDPVFDRVVLRAIAKRPAQRFQYAAAFAEALREAAQASQDITTPIDPTILEAVHPPAPMALATPRVTVTRIDSGASRVSLLVAALGLLIALGIGGWLYLFSSAPSAPPPMAMAPSAPVQPRPPAITAMTADTLPPAAEVMTAAPAQVAVPLSPEAPSSARPTTSHVPELLPSPAFTASGRTELIRLVSGLDCAIVDGVIGPEGATLRGLSVPGTEALLRRSLAERRVTGRLEWQVADTNAAFCSMLSVLRMVVPALDSDAPRVRLTLADDRTVLREGDAIRPRVIMPAFSGYLTADYITHDGTVQHLYPQVADARLGIKADSVRRFAPSEWVNLGDPGPGQRGWEASEPYGQDLIITIASSRPLFAKARPSNAEVLDVYLRALSQAVRELRQNGDLVAAAAIGVQVSPR